MLRWKAEKREKAGLSLIFEGCKFPLSESYLIRGIAPSFSTLWRLEIYDNFQITDKLARSVARCCPNLETFCVSGCPSISALSALALMETAFFRVSQMLTVHMEKTAFDVDQPSNALFYQPLKYKPLQFEYKTCSMFNCSRKTMWDLLILTAGSESQKCDFETHLSEIDISDYCRDTVVIADYPPGVRIGSGGATLNALQSLGGQRVGQKVRITKFKHIGSLHKSATCLLLSAPLFLKCCLEKRKEKTALYMSLSAALPAGLLVSASDVLEDVSTSAQCYSSSDMILFATELDTKVFSFFWMSWWICEQLVKLWKLRGPCTIETCCYGDFMRPLGYEPLLDYLEEGRRILLIGSGSLLEYCNLKDAQIGSGCILSGCESSERFSLDDYSILFTLCTTKHEHRYITVLLHIDDEVKVKKPTLCWMGKETHLKETSLWNAKLFPVERSRQASLHATLSIAKGRKTTRELISISEAVTTSDTQEMVGFRRQLKHKHLANKLTKNH
uniref:Fucokinase domain-containing protein n=1 Tax=Angiostrongylus cantonensis TaxID=6313 RepID=A0A158PBW7_ANGCA